MSKRTMDPDDAVKCLMSKWGERPCPMCGNNDWLVSARLYELREYDPGDSALTAALIAVLPVTCERCGNTVLVNAKTIDLVVEGVGEDG